MSDVEEKSGAESGGLVRRRRRRWSEAQKRQIVAETHEPGVSVPMVAQRYNVNANQVFAWRRLFREPARDTGIDGFVPVVVGARRRPRPDRRPATDPAARNPALELGGRTAAGPGGISRTLHRAVHG